jgi:beta-N-acetylhexosaminidase
MPSAPRPDVERAPAPEVAADAAVSRAPDQDVARLACSVLMPGFCGTEVPGWLSRAAGDGLGGVCLFAPNVGDDVAALTGQLHGIRADLLVASDEEGGEVTRLEAASGSSWPGHAALGRLDEVDGTRRIARAIGRQSRAAGIDLVLAPDVDVTSNPDNPVIGLRSFGADPALVSRHAAAFVEGLHHAGVAGCAKHFPGHGDTRTDSHVGLPVIDADLDTLRRRDLPPFAATVTAGVDAVMTAHVVFPAIDSAPATLSPSLLGLLREDLGFHGVIISDALDMKAISAGVGRGPGAVLALAAGVDLVCIGNPSHPTRYDDEAAFHEVHDAIVEAVGTGRLPRARLEEAAQRVIALAGRVAELRHSEEDGSGPVVTDADGPGAAQELARSVAGRVLEAHGSPRLDTRPLHVLDLRGTPNLASGPRPSGVLAALRGRAPDVTVHHIVHEPEPVYALVAALAEAEGCSVLALIGSPHRSPNLQRLLDTMVALRPDTVVISTGLPDERDRLGEHWVRTWGDSLPAGAAVAELLLG